MHFQRSEMKHAGGHGPVSEAEELAGTHPMFAANGLSRSPRAATTRSRWERLPAVLVLFIAVAGGLSFVATYRHFLNPSQDPVIRSDGAGYYSYLPAYLIQRDPTFRTFVAKDRRLIRNDGQSQSWHGYRRQRGHRHPAGRTIGAGWLESLRRVATCAAVAGQSARANPSFAGRPD